MSTDDNRADLAASAAALAEEVKGLHTAVTDLAKRTRRSERTLILVIFVVLVDFVLSIAFVLLLHAQGATNAQLAASIHEQQITRRQVICPVFALSIGGYAPETRAPGPARDTYIATVNAMRESYNVLHCTNPIVAPRTTPPG